MLNPQNQILFVYTESDSTWNGPLSLEELKKRIIGKNLISTFQIWIKNFCPNGHKIPERCNLHENDIIIDDIERIYDSLSEKSDNKSVNSEEFEKIVKYLSNQHVQVNTNNVINTFKKRLKLKEFLMSVLLNNLNIYEAYLLGSYCDLFASKLNTDLRRAFIGGKAEDLVLSERLLNTSLEKLKSHDDNVVFVMFQTGDDFEDILNWFKNRIGKIVKFPNFLSSSLKKWNDYELYLKIETKLNSRGRYVAPYTDKGDLEEEVTFMSSSKFRVISYNEDLKELYLKEEDYEANEDYSLDSLFYMNYRDIEDNEV